MILEMEPVDKPLDIWSTETMPDTKASSDFKEEQNSRRSMVQRSRLSVGNVPPDPYSILFVLTEFGAEDC
jgi:hypothetical protein